MSRAESKLAKDSLWMVLSRFAAQGLTVIFTVILARRLGSAGFGEYAFIAALIYVANSLTTFGTDMVLIREIAARDDLSGLPAALVLQLGLSAFLIATVWFFGSRIPNQGVQAIQGLKIFSLSLIPLAFFTVFSTALRGRQRMDAYALLNLMVPAVQVGILLLPAHDLVLLSVFLLTAQIITALLACWMCTLVLPGFWRASGMSVPRLGSLLKACAPLALLTVLGMTYQRLNVYMLSMLAGPVDTGMFSAAARAVEASKTVHLALFATLYPAMALAQNRGADSRRLNEGIRISRTLLLAGGTLGALLLFIFARPIISILYGGEYSLSIPVLQILSWTLIPFTVNSYFTLSFVASHREGWVGGALAASLLSLFLLNLWQIPAQGAVGSAWAAVAAECLQSAILLAGTQVRLSVEGAARELPHLPG